MIPRFCLILFILLTTAMSAQDQVRTDSSAAIPVLQEQHELARDTVRSARLAPDTIRVRTPYSDPSTWVVRKDSLTLWDYHHAGEVFARHPGVVQYDLGNFGQPYALGLYGSLPSEQSITVNGVPFDDLHTGMANTYMLSTEDADRFMVYPQYLAFWYGNPGDVFAANLRERSWNAPRPVTRLRHTEAANEYLYTDAMFTLNPAPESNLYIAATRTVIGGNTGNNAARFDHTRHESWNIRGRYERRHSALLRSSLRLRYNDDITYLNGGVAGIFSAEGQPPLIYEQDGTGSFPDEAFDPKAATLVNESMLTGRQRYSADLGFNLQWTQDSTQVTSFHLQAVSDVRRFSDDLQSLRSDSLAVPFINVTDHWTRYQAVLRHETDLNWAELSLHGSIGRYAAEKGGDGFMQSGIDARLRGRLRLQLGPASLSGYAGIDHRFDQSALSFGAGAALPLGAVSLWGGASFAPRIRSLVESRFTSPLVSVEGDRTPDLDKYGIVEAGMRLETEMLRLDIRGFVRREDRNLLLQSAAYTDMTLGRFSLHFTSLPGSVARTASGGSAFAELIVSGFHLEQRLGYTSTESDLEAFALPSAPELQYAADLYYRGTLIEETLNLKLGGRFTYASAYHPPVYHPETGLFTLPLSFDDGTASYTDMLRIDLYLFATIKQRATIHVLLHNVLDAQYITSAFYPMYDRALRFGVDWVFLD